MKPNKRIRSLLEGNRVWVEGNRLQNDAEESLLVKSPFKCKKPRAKRVGGYERLSIQTPLIR